MVLRILLLLCLTATTAFAVDRSKFRTCEQTSFCRRHRGKEKSSSSYQLKDVVFHTHEAPQDLKQEGLWKSFQRTILGEHASRHADDPYLRGPSPTLTGTMVPSNASPQGNLSWSLTALQDGMIRMRITELHQPRVTYDQLVLESTLQGVPEESLQWVTPSSPEHAQQCQKLGITDGSSTYLLHHDKQWILVWTHPVFQLQVVREDGKPVVTINGKDWMHFELRQNKKQSIQKEQQTRGLEEQEDQESEKEIVGYWEDGLAIYADGTREEKRNDEHRNLEEEEEDEGMWEEHFQSHLDTKPFGPMSVGMDVTFHNSQHVYGIPEHASSAVLKTTTGENAHYHEPYRLYNLDVFEYELNETMALYGSVPLMVTQSAQTGTAAIFWFNPTETFIDVAHHGDDTWTHWISESGVLDIFILPGPEPPAVYKQYAALTGVTPLPPMFSLGYHQCRWNYKDEKDVYYVHSKFEELDYPYDVLWLDIEHTDGKRYFTWDNNLFPQPKEMIETLASQGRRMVTIIDPHIKRDENYYIHKEATAKGLYIKDNSGKKDYDGWCWPGSSSYLDFTDARVRKWWAEQFHYNKYHGSTPTLYTWNDMNEPSVFNGPEVSMQKDLLNLAGVEHREWHNLYGMLFHRATAEGHLSRNSVQETRPFVLSRSFFAGSQKYGAIWTGDNTAEWGHLAIATPMLLSLNAASLSFVGADIGGFFGNPDAELFTRWMQAGAYQPFFRGHAHHDSKRREPWMFDDDTLRRLRHAAMQRYALLPYWYTVFYQAEETGMPVMRMMWMQYPKTPALYGTEDHFLIGSDLLVRPVTQPGVFEVNVSFPTDDIWYNGHTLVLESSDVVPNGVHTRTVPADLDTIPLFQRGGSILVRKLRLRRSTMCMKADPYTLYVALSANHRADGTLYIDDEESLGYRSRQEFAIAKFSADFHQGIIKNQAHLGKGWLDFFGDNTAHLVERIIIMGVLQAPKSIICKNSGEEEPLSFEFEKERQTLIIRKPEVSAISNWTLAMTF